MNIMNALDVKVTWILWDLSFSCSSAFRLIYPIKTRVNAAYTSLSIFERL